MRIVTDAVAAERAAKAQQEHKRQLMRWTIYKFQDETGRVVFEKVRKQLDAPPPRNKTFWYQYWEESFSDGRSLIYGKPAEADLLLYRLPQLLRAKASGSDVWWTEGEKDAGRLEEELDGEACAVSHHQAAGHSTLEQAEWFRGHAGFVGLLMDLDEDGPTGANPGVFDVIRRYDQLRSVGLPRDRLRVFAPKVGKDVYDHLSAGLGLADLVAVTDLRPLREKAERGSGFAAWGYGEDLTEITEAIENWSPTVVQS